MCTVSWLHQPDGFELFCNRDERRTRKAALPPQMMELRGVRAIAPRDGDFGGSWISVNEFGLALSLLNLYQAQHKSNREFTSRGLLLTALADCRSQTELIRRIGEMDLKRFQPFTLLALAPNAAALIVQWDGRACAIDRNGDARMPLTSSSFDSGKVIEARKQQFGELPRVDSAALRDFHRSHQPALGAYSVCMHRPDAETVSFSRVKVDSDSVAFSYHPNAPCREGEATIQILTRARQ
ncbi:MAG TPA: NRDE family protein [Blastocatellia bacterium]|nr:NRDE family protein [Blastocatellia bacterium]HMX29304.1 NRDE family protein [Blastocatellia bacterium]HMY70828.1 NRDE family protein [Blastocatellia bacterium]HMZ23161.1 NRDE family protein [Blastocatellia bacterium]HNG30987.1 NRDE family protein [Blastocatellia bacterium]